MSTIILRVASRVLVPLSLIFGLYIYFKGHQTPGGGFVGGLVTAVALVVHRMSYGSISLHRLMPAKERSMIALGLTCALGTGAASLVAGQPLPALPFFTSNHGFLPMSGPAQPGDGGYAFEWATVMVFDLGVMLVVAGVVVGMIDVLSKELEDAAR